MRGPGAAAAIELGLRPFDLEGAVRRADDARHLGRDGPGTDVAERVRLTRIIVEEAGATLGWCQWVGDKGASIGVDRFGESAPMKDSAQHLGLTVDNVVQQALALLGDG